MSPQNKEKLLNKQKRTIATVFGKILHWLVKPQFQQIKQQSHLRNQIHGLIILHFHIYNVRLLRKLYQLPKYNTIVFYPTSKHPITYDDTTPEPCFSATEVELNHIRLSTQIGFDAI